MRKILPVIIGILIGAVASVGMIHAEQRVAHGEINFWDEVVAYGDFFDWNDLFTGSSKPTGLYKLVYKKLLQAPKKDALRQVAQKYGLTLTEAEQVLAGAYTPLYNNPNRRGATLTQEAAIVLVQNVQNDFNLYQQTLQLEQEVNVAVAPGEIFANGDLSDSGFDLIYDLSVMEEVLFLQKTQNTVGAPFDGELSSPFLPTVPDQILTDYVAAAGPAAVVSFLQEDSALDIDAEVLEEDVCPSEDDLVNALGEFEEREEAADGGAGGSGEPGISGVGASGADDAGQAAEQPLEPAAAANWTKAWCPAFAGQEGAGATQTFGSTGFSSLGNFVGSAISQGISAGAAAGVSAGGMAAHIAVCFDVTPVKKTAVSYYPGQGCILCEVQNINHLLKKTLSHSLVPSKATGNLMESAKCKRSYSLSAVNMNLITIAAPVSTPPNDDLILSKNIFEEWKKFTDRYQPFLYPSGGTVVEMALATPSENTTTTQESVLNSLSASLAQEKAEALREIENQTSVNYATNTALFARTVLGEIRQMNTFFKGYLTQYGKIGNELCPAIEEKQGI